MNVKPVLRGLDAVTVPVPDLDEGVAFYHGKLGHQLLWRNALVLVELTRRYATADVTRPKNQ